MKPNPTKEGIRPRQPSRRFPRGGWEVRYVDPEGRTKRKTFERKEDAKNFRDGVKEDIRRGRYIDPKRSRALVREVAEAWFEAIDVRPTTRAAYAAMLTTYIYPGIGNVRLDRVAPTTLLAFRNRLDDLHRTNAEALRRRRIEERAERGREPREEKPIRPLSETRKLHVFQVLNAILNSAVRDGYLDSNPMKRLNKTDKPRRDRRKMLFLDAAQVDALGTAVDPRFRTLVYILAYGGMRAGEVAALRIEDVDLEAGTVLLDESVSDIKGELVLGKPKTEDSVRTVHLPTFLVEMLREQISDRRANPKAFVFPGYDGEPMRMANFYNRHFKDAVRRALPDKLHGLRLHDLRHTAASLAYFATLDIKAVQERLGHSSITTTMDRYGHLYDAAQKALAGRLDEMYRAAMGSPAAPDATVTELRP